MWRAIRSTDVFGISTEILDPSYVDRGALDNEIKRYLSRDTHIALRGESKSGKSWIRKRNIPNAIVLQCRLNKTVIDLYVDALSQLDIRFAVEETKKGTLKGSVEASAEGGLALLGKVFGKATVGAERESSSKNAVVGHDINDLRFIAEIIRSSGRRLVIEDFHYLSSSEKKVVCF